LYFCLRMRADSSAHAHSYTYIVYMYFYIDPLETHLHISVSTTLSVVGVYLKLRGCVIICEYNFERCGGIFEIRDKD
jgi:hypothetical protein